MSDDPDQGRRALLVGGAAAGIEALAYARPARATSSLQPDARLVDLKHAYDQSLVPAREAHALHGRLEAQYFALRHHDLTQHQLDEAKRAIGLVQAEAAVDAADDASLAIIEEIAATPAEAMRGIRLKAAILRAEDESVPELVTSILDDLLSLEA